MPENPSPEDLWNWVRAREAIRLLRESGEPRPWTDDPIMAEYHFCNIRREHDRGTRFYIDVVASDHSMSEPDLYFHTIAYRLINNVEWYEKFGEPALSLDLWRSDRWNTLKRVYAAGTPYSPAYLTFGGTPKGMSHIDSLAKALDWLAVEGSAEAFVQRCRQAESLNSVWILLQEVPSVGPFIAMQIYRDLILKPALSMLRFTDNDFCFIGPGAMEALEQLFGPATYSEQFYRLQQLWQEQPPDLDLSLCDVQHCLCEARKYWGIQAWKAGRRDRPRLRTFSPRYTPTAIMNPN